MKNDRDFIFLNALYFSIVQNFSMCRRALTTLDLKTLNVFHLVTQVSFSLLLIEYQERCLYRLNGLVSLMESTHLLLRTTQRVSYVS